MSNDKLHYIKIMAICLVIAVILLIANIVSLG